MAAEDGDYTVKDLTKSGLIGREGGHFMEVPESSPDDAGSPSSESSEPKSETIVSESTKIQNQIHKEGEHNKSSSDDHDNNGSNLLNRNDSAYDRDEAAKQDPANYDARGRFVSKRLTELIPISHEDYTLYWKHP